MTSELKILASRANGAKSRGPVTPEGKQRSKMNALRHGLCAEVVLLDGERPDAFEELHAEILAVFQPADITELKLAELATASLWRIARAWEYEKRIMNKEIRRQPEGLAADRAGDAFAELADNHRSLDLLLRYDTKFERQYHRSLHRLQRLRATGHRPTQIREACVGETCVADDRVETLKFPNEPDARLTPASSPEPSMAPSTMDTNLNQ